MMKRLVGIVFLALSVMCTQAARAGEIELNEVKLPTDGMGIVLISLSLSGAEPVAFVRLNLHEGSFEKPMATANVGKPFIAVNETFSAKDGRWGRLLAFSLRPGTWRVGSLQVTMNNGGGGRVELRNTPNLDRTFEVKPNSIRYLGNLDAIVARGEPLATGDIMAAVLFGILSSNISGHPFVSDLSERDYQILLQANPALDLATIEKALIRTPSDEAIERVAKEWLEKAERGDAAALAAVADASFIGASLLPSQDYLRLPASSVFNHDNFEKFRRIGSAELRHKLFEWSNAERSASYIRTPPQLTLDVKTALLNDSARMYFSQAVMQIGQGRVPGAEMVEARQRDWKIRWSGLEVKRRFSAKEQIGLLVGSDAAERYFSADFKRKVLVASADGKSFWGGSEGLEPFDQQVRGVLSQCEKAGGQGCSVVAVNSAVRFESCSANHIGAGLASEFPPIDFSPVDIPVAERFPWAKALNEWQAAAANKWAVLPRTMVWDDVGRKAYFAAGNCLSAFRAMSSCVADGNKSCKIVVQDDRVVVDTEFGNSLTARILAKVSVGK